MTAPRETARLVIGVAYDAILPEAIVSIKVYLDGLTPDIERLLAEKKKVRSYGKK